MNNIVDEISINNGTITLMDDGTILIEGNYWVINDKKISQGNKDIKITSTDILDVNITSYSNTPCMIKSCILFALAIAANTLKGTVGGYASDVKKVTDTTKNTIEYLDTATNNEYISNISSSAKEVNDYVSSVSEVMDTIFLITAIVLFVLSVVTLIKYLTSYKKLVEVNTYYGSFCVDFKANEKVKIDRFINNYNTTKKKKR